MNNLKAIIFHNAGLLIIFFGALIALGFAFFAQYHGGYHPCELCLVQRWIYGAIILAIFPAHARVIKPRKFTNLGSFILCLIIAIEVAAAAYHFGIEQKWWQGFQACSSGLPEGLSIEDLRNKVNTAPVTRCDQATWYFIGLSMAGWNVIYSFGLFLVSLLVATKFQIAVNNNNEHNPADKT